MKEEIKLPTLKTRERVLDIRNDLSIDDFIEALNKARAAGATTVCAWYNMFDIGITAYRAFSEEEMRDKYIKLLQDKIDSLRQVLAIKNTNMIQYDSIRSKLIRR